MLVRVIKLDLRLRMEAISVNDSYLASEFVDMFFEADWTLADVFIGNYL